MLPCVPYEDMKLKSIRREGDALVLVLQKGMQKIVPVGEGIVRVLYSQKELGENEYEKPCLAELAPFPEWSYTEEESFVRLEMPRLVLYIDKETNSFRYADENGRTLLRERAARSKELTEIPVYRLLEESAGKEIVETADGKKEVIRDAARVQCGSAYHTRLHFVFDGDEELYGLGQHEEGYHSLRGNCVYLNQANRTIAIPFFISTKAYGVFMNTCSPSIFNDGPEGSYFYTEADTEMDFFFMNGGSMDGVIRAFRKITGKAVLLPKWAFGYIQSQERYETQKEILEVAGEYRKRAIGLDCIVLDWISWPEGQWGQKSFDAARFPDPDAMTKQLHEENVHFMISIWPNMDPCTENVKEFEEKKLLLPGSHIYNALDAEARKLYWKQAEEGLFKHGVDAWWCDNSEPVCPEWTENVRPENAKNFENYCRNVSDHIPAPYMNAFGLYHARGIFEGQRKACPSKRVVNLTRSGYPGQQRYGTILWSGDISASWDTLRKQIAAGIHFCASGMPYWTTDTGAFFVKNGYPWYWNGEYDGGAEDPAYCELYTRWYQWEAFLPVFRGHGTDVRRELWVFDHEAAPFYPALLEASRRRYALMPYIYSLAGMVWLRDALIMKPLSFAFGTDRNCFDIFDQYLFGDDMMVCPVTEAMNFDVEKKPESYSRRVYLPEGCDWYDFYTDERYAGGQWISAAAPLEHIPVFVRAGAIIPMTEPALSVAELSDEITLHIYPGSDGAFTMYEDAGDSYAYENGEYTLHEFVWKDKEQKLFENGTERTEQLKLHVR
ncbi:MAG: DUF5110 domain-containing protein [Lachnospiraceae bacterium]|nr:DUF5110 domain-containing protein [Lachnospiraceae bacterium]